MLILTDGLPNLAVGHNDLVSYEGLTSVINQTKSTLSALENTNVITILTGVKKEVGNLASDGTNFYTYGQVIENVFGTEESPTVGTFYNINDSEIEQTITDKVYNDLLPVKSSLKDICIVDYIPQYIADNFDITLNQDSLELSAIISDNGKTVTWNIDELSPDESKILKIDLTLKNNFNEEIIDKILDTNEKVDIVYKDFDGTDKSDSSDVTPKIKLNAVPQPEPPNDVTVSPEPLPDAGSSYLALAFVILAGLATFFGYKMK
jgi:hypothetical protein